MIFLEKLEKDLIRVRAFSFVVLLFVIYAIYYDLTFLKVAPNSLWYFAKTYFILGPFLILYLKIIPKDLKRLILGLHWVIYCTYHVYFISLSYYMTFAQAAIAFSVMVMFTRVQYIIFATFCFIASAYSIMYSQHEMFYVAAGMSAKSEILINNICFQFVCYIAYYYITIPKLNLTMAEKRFADYGKASSFIMHEMAKPINRMNQNPENFKEELNRLNEIYTIANSIRSKENHKVILEGICIESFINEILSKYDSFITMFEIEVKIKSEVKDILTDKKLMFFTLDNLIRNAIEANIEYQGKRYIDVLLTQKVLIVKNPFLSINFSKENLFKPMYTTKQGHMGVGLYISKMIVDNLGHQLNIEFTRDFFKAQIDLT